MARKKVNLSYITSNSVRRNVFRKRSSGLIKKVRELSILCDVKACAVIYEDNESQPLVWPSEPEARRIIEDFRANPEYEQSKKMMSQATFPEERATKIAKKLNRAQRAVHQAEMKVMMYEGMAGSYEGLYGAEVAKATQLSYFVETYLKEVRKQIEEAKVREATAVKEAVAVEGGGRETIVQTMINELSKVNWFGEMGNGFEVGGPSNYMTSNNNNDDDHMMTTTNDDNCTSTAGNGDLDSSGYEGPWVVPDSPYLDPIL